MMNIFIVRVSRKYSSYLFIDTAFKNRYDEYFRETRTMQEFRFGNYIVAVGIPTKEYIANFTKTN